LFKFSFLVQGFWFNFSGLMLLFTWLEFFQRFSLLDFPGLPTTPFMNLRIFLSSDCFYKD